MENTIDNNEISYGLTEKELNNIKTVIETCGELYFYFGVTNDATKEEIKDCYAYILSEYTDINEIDEKGRQFLVYFKMVYKILSNPSTRLYYDNELYLNTRNEYMTSEEQTDDRIIKYMTSNSLKSLVFSGICSFAIIPIENIFKRLVGMNGIVSPVSVIKSIYNQGGISGGMFKGCGILFGVIPISQFLIDFPMEIILRKYLGHPKYNRIYDIIYTTQSNLTPFPLILMYDIISMSPLAMGTFDIIKSVILRKVDGDNGTTTLQWKNLFYSFVYSTSILLTRRLLLDGINSLEKRISKAALNYPNSTLLKYSQRFISNKLVLGTISALVCCPLDVIRYQYPNDLIKSYINNTPLPYAINPISMAIKIYNNQSIWKLYNGLLLEIPIYCFSKFSQPPSVANINIYSIS